ncbi:helix-turn-helix domain-containing protein [bacterium]|nr:helix-turn-helix domain-containing protein [bacterium]
MESIGETLREARHRKQVELTDAARFTKIKPEILEQLEADDFSRLASPAYTKGFLKLYADYLGLDGQQLVSAYLASQGGLRRQGLHLETEATLRARQARELHLSLARVALVVAALTALVVIVYALTSWWSHRAERRAETVPTPPPVTVTVITAQPVTLPRADFEPYYQPKTMTVPDTLEMAATGR